MLFRSSAVAQIRGMFVGTEPAAAAAGTGTRPDASTLLAPEQIGFVKFIIEAYDDLAVLSTTNPLTGEIMLGCHQANYAELCDLLRGLGVEICHHGTKQEP